MINYPQPYVMQPPTYYSIDVECVATGNDHNARSVAQIGLVDQYERVLLVVYVKPEQPVVSYLTPLTGLTQEIIDAKGTDLQSALHLLRQTLPRTAILVGQNIGKDVEWLQLREGTDFQDLTGLFRVWNPVYRSYSVFGQDHVASVLLEWPADGPHDAVTDAVKSIRLFNYFQQLQQDPERLKQAKDALLAASPLPSFAKKNPTFDGVCMGNRRTCRCGAPFLG